MDGGAEGIGAAAGLGRAEPSESLTASLTHNLTLSHNLPLRGRDNVPGGRLLTLIATGVCVGGASIVRFDKPDLLCKTLVVLSNPVICVLKLTCGCFIFPSSRSNSAWSLSQPTKFVATRRLISGCLPTLIASAEQEAAQVELDQNSFSASMPDQKDEAMKRREFLSNVAAGAAALGVAGCTTRQPGAGSASKKTLMMKAGHQHDHSAATLQALAAFGVNHICSGRLSANLEDWSVAALTRLRKHVESFGIALDAVPLPMNSHDITRAELPEILLAKAPERDRALENIAQMIRNAGAAGIPLVKYNLTFLGVVRTGRVRGRGGASLSAFDYAQAKQEPPLTEAGPISEEIYWDRITYFLKRVVPAAEEAQVRIALHPQDPALPKKTGFRGVHTVLGSVDGLKRFVQTVPSRYHGLNFCQGTVSEMLEKPGEQIYDVIRWFGDRGKIFNVHFRNIRGGFLKFQETLPDDGDVDMPRALRAYREVGYDGMIMPDHVPMIAGDTGGQKAFAFCFGYIQALLQQLRAET